MQVVDNLRVNTNNCATNRGSVCHVFRFVSSDVDMMDEVEVDQTPVEGGHKAAPAYIEVWDIMTAANAARSSLGSLVQTSQVSLSLSVAHFCSCFFFYSLGLMRDTAVINQRLEA